MDEWSPCKKMKIWTQTHEEGHVSEIGVMIYLQAKEWQAKDCNHQKQEDARRDPHLEPLERTLSCQQFNFGFLASRIGREYLLL